MKNRIVYGVIVSVLTVNLALGFMVYDMAAADTNEDDPYQSMRTLTQVMEMIREDYVDNGKVGYDDLVNAALRGMVSALDPHSEYMPPRRFDDLRSDTEGHFGGLGIVVSVRDNWLTVLSPMEGTPGYDAGIITGDRIVKIDGMSTENVTLAEAVGKLRGKAGTEVELTLFRPGKNDTFDVKVERAVIKVSSVKDLSGKSVDQKGAFSVLDDNIGYIRVLQFGEHTASDIRKALERMTKNNMTSLILDLRGNPGGLLDQAVKICDFFLPRNQPILTTEGRKQSQLSSYRSRGLVDYSGIQIAVLVDGGSASASEIVAGCLQDSTASGVCDAVIIGEQTFGKGSVQSILPLNNGAALRLTTAKYYTPSHKVIHKQGIKPDIAVSMTREEHRGLVLRRGPGGLNSVEDKGERERYSKMEDRQFNRAVDILKGLRLLKKSAPKADNKVARN
ncbi:S41 family peptidase [Verrucomicrobia bacterium]|nr:S41 family peptidase [Verrucomicrobiota bacterium]